MSYRDAVLAKALMRAAQALGLSNKELTRAIKVGGEVPLLMIYQNLFKLLGGDEEKSRAWFDSPNTHVGIPRDRVQSVGGQAAVVAYLSACVDPMSGPTLDGEQPATKRCRVPGTSTKD